MLILADTNVLLRLVERNHPQHLIAIEAIRSIRTRGDRPVIVPQVIYEFWVVATRGLDANGLGLIPARAHTELDGLSPSFTLLRDERVIFEVWQSWFSIIKLRENAPTMRD